MVCERLQRSGSWKGTIVSEIPHSQFMVKPATLNNVPRPQMSGKFAAWGDSVDDESVVEGSRGTYIKDEVIGYMLVYVDDTMVIGTTSLIERVFEIYKSIWDVKVTGILVADDVPTEMLFLKYVSLAAR